MEEIRIPLEGIDRDSHELQRKEGAYTTALNATVSSKSGNVLAIQNESANLKAYDFSDFQLIGNKYFSEYNKHIVFLTNGRTSRIGLIQFKEVVESDYEENQYCEDCEQRTSYSHVPKASANFELLVEASCLNFSKHYPITCEYKLTNCSLNIYFRDSNNENRYLYFDIKGTKFFLQNKFKVGYKNDCDGESYTEQLNCTYAGWYQKYTSPNIETSFDNGGSLKEGVYQVIFAWSTSKGIPLSSYKSLTNPLPLFTNTVKTATDQETTKGLRIKIDHSPDVIYNFYNLVIAETINEATRYIQVTLPKDQKEYFYTSSLGLVPTDIGQVLQKYPYYKNSDYMSQANGYLIQGGLREFEKMNLQRVANKVKLKWQTIQLKEGDYADPVIAQNYRGYLRDEQYIPALVFEFDNGEESPLYPIPGREATASERQLVADPTNDDPNAANKMVERWRIYNTASVTFSPHNPYNKDNPQVWEEGEFGYWESSDSYPNLPEIWGDLCGKPIRIPKFPDAVVSNHFDNKNFALPAWINGYVNPTNYIYPIGFKIVSNIEQLLNEAVAEKLITQEQRNRIVRYKVVRANRFGNRSIHAKGWVYNTKEYQESNGRAVRFPNYPFNDLRPDQLIARNDDRQASSVEGDNLYNIRKNPVVSDNKPYYTFHSPNTHFANQSLGSVLKLEAETYGTSKGNFAKVNGEAEHKLLTQRHYNFAFVIASVIARAYQPTDTNMSGSSQSLGQGVGSAAGAAIGSIIPGVGTAIGSIVGGILGGMIGSMSAKDSDKLKAGPRAVMWLAQTERIIELITLSTKFWQFHYQWQATGKYFAFTPKANDSNKLFKLRTWKYLSPESTSIPVRNGTVLFNNWERESSVFLETDRPIPNPTVIDNSNNSAMNLFEVSNDGTHRISAYYASIKNEVRNQYGSVYSPQYITTSSKSYHLNEQPLVFGGDTYLGSMSIKRKHRFFTDSTYLAGNGSDIYYEDLGNAGFPVYWFNTRNVDVTELNLLEGLTFLPDLGTTIQSLSKSLLASKSILSMSGSKNTIPVLTQVLSLGILSLFNKKENLGDKLVSEFMEDIGDFFQAQLMSPDKYFKPARYNLDLTILTAGSSDGLSTQGAMGRIYLYSYGINTYICESDVNLDLRHAENGGERAFYPNQSNLDYWLQHQNVPFGTDNYFFYNNTYSKQPKESSFVINDINFRPYDECRVDYPNQVIYSLQDAEVEDNSLRDNWLINLALDKENFSLSLGFLRGIDQIENDKVVLRFEDGIRMFAAYNQLVTDQDTVQVGNGGLFKSKPITFAETDYGYYGSQNRAFLSTEYGHVSIDAKRGHIFVMGSNGQMTDEITRYGLRKWFAENLPFEISKHFTVNTDNAFNGIGITMVYDSLLKRIIITKLDYKPKRKGIVFNPDDNEFYYQGKRIEVKDQLYFYNLSWTISYDLEQKKFISWHAYKPNYYLGEINRFFSNENNTLWIHGVTNKLYQQVYGKQVPFLIDGFAKPNVTKIMLKSVTFSTESIQYLNEFDSRSTNVTFEEAEVYNKEQHSGTLKLIQVDKDNLGERIKYPIAEADGNSVILDRTEEEFSFNQFNDKSVNNLSFWVLDPVQVTKKINPDSISYFKNELSCNKLKSQIHFVRLTNQTNSTSNIIVKYIKLEYNGGLRTR